MKILTVNAISIVLLFPDNNLKAEEPDTWGVGAHPVIGYEAETSLTLGAGAVIYFEPESKNQDLDEVEFITSYNLKKQYDLVTGFSKYFRDNKYSIEGEIGYIRAPDDFHGIGNDVSGSTGMSYDAAFVPVDIACSVRLFDYIYAGPVYSFQYGNVTVKETDPWYVDRDLRGTGVMYSSGMGAHLVYKSTPKGQLYKRSGTYCELKGVHYARAFLGSSSFDTMGIDYRHYFPIFSQGVLGVQFIGKRSAGEVPFYYFPVLGGSKILRGGGGYAAANLIAAQAEYRFPVFWRIGAAVFAGAGEVEEHAGDFGKNVRVAGGPGIRLTLNKKKNITLRFDLALDSRGNKDIYIKILEAF
ncbi:MAG: hypothetical protein EPN93_07650 [Spirochaetes bacterium]|nr:MAG: hypothetical protein EPN93_07650 [Spirochaetota bacterium]